MALNAVWFPCGTWVSIAVRHVYEVPYWVDITLLCWRYSEKRPACNVSLAGCQPPVKFNPLILQKKISRCVTDCLRWFWISFFATEYRPCPLAAFSFTNILVTLGFPCFDTGDIHSINESGFGFTWQIEYNSDVIWRNIHVHEYGGKWQNADETGFKQNSPNPNLDSDSLIEYNFLLNLDPNPYSLIEYPHSSK